MSDEKLRKASALLEAAVERRAKAGDDPLAAAALAKAFEAAFEYAWKLFKQQGDAAGLEIYSPRDALKAAAQLHLISDLELWNRILNARNLSVHDYIGLDDLEFQELAREFLAELRKL